MGDNYPFTSVDNGGPVSRERLAEIREQAEYCSITVEAEELLWLLGQADDAKRLRAENTAQAAALAAVAAVADRIAPHAENMCRIGELEIGVPLRTAVRDIRSALGLDQDGRGNA